MVAAARMCFFSLEGKVKKILKPRYYKHIDKIIKPADLKIVERKIKNKNYIIHHGFYPFLSYTSKFKKFIKIKDENQQSAFQRKIKSRPIKYASHIDRCIYQWYSYKINNAYNDYCNQNNLNENVIAYRTCLRGRTNIEFAKEAFDFIKKSQSCYILVSDFTDFFDTIDHKKLKSKLCEILNTSKLEQDFYKVFRSMTRYTYIEKDAVLKYLNTKGVTKEMIKNNNSLFEQVSWNIAKKDLKEEIKVNKEIFGIPQGSPLSGIFANVYMIDFDKSINEYAKSKNGLYLRYSDDLIIIIPVTQSNSIKDIWQKVSKIKDKYETLKMNLDKTSGYIYDNKKIKSLHQEVKGMKNGGTTINYLGFSFDGKNVKFRDKTLTKFFYKLYRKIDSMKKREQDRLFKGKKKHTKIDKHQILKILNGNNKEARKFIDYANRAKRVFKDEKYIINFRKNIKDKVFKRFDKNKTI